jgi:hypothetical protein
VSAWRSRLSWILLAVLVIAVVVLAASYSRSLDYAVVWSAVYSFENALTQYVGYGAYYVSNWTASLMPYAFRMFTFGWNITWDAAIMPGRFLVYGANWFVNNRTWAVYNYGYPGGKKISIQVDPTVYLAPNGTFWKGFVVVNGTGSGNMTLPSGVVLVPFGNIVVSGSKFNVSGYGKLVQRVNCYINRIQNPRGDPVATRASVNGTAVSVGYSFPCLTGMAYNVSVSGWKVANVKIGVIKYKLPFVLQWQNSTDIYIYVTVADPVVINITKIDVVPLRFGLVQVNVYGYVYDNITKTRISGGAVTLEYNGMSYDFTYTEDDGSFHLFMMDRISGPCTIKVKFSHIDYLDTEAQAQFTVETGTGGGLPSFELPSNTFNYVLIALAVIAIAVAIMIAKKKNVLAVAVAENEYLERR